MGDSSKKKKKPQQNKMWKRYKAIEEQEYYTNVVLDKNSHVELFYANCSCNCWKKGLKFWTLRTSANLTAQNVTLLCSGYWQHWKQRTSKIPDSFTSGQNHLCLCYLPSQAHIQGSLCGNCWKHNHCLRQSSAHPSPAPSPKDRWHGQFQLM